MATSQKSVSKKQVEAAAPVPMADFGKDHWSLLGYVQTRCADSFHPQGVGELDKKHLRCNAARHPIHATFIMSHRERAWKPEYGTRLHGDGRDGSRQLPDHDDWDCLDDLEAAGLLEVISTANGFVKLTDAGLDMAAALVKHKASGGWFSNFTPA